MSLIPCPACQQPLSPQASTCPQCGHPVAADRPARPQVRARFSDVSALWRAFVFGGWGWVALGVGVALRWAAVPDQPLVTDWKPDAVAWAVGLAVLLVVPPCYHLSKLFRRSPRLILDPEGMRGPFVPGEGILWDAVRNIEMTSGQRVGVDYATWDVELKDGRHVKIRGLATLTVPARDLFDVVRNMLATGTFKLPPKRFWSRLWT